MKDLLKIFENQVMVLGLTKKKLVSKLEELPQEVIQNNSLWIMILLIQAI